MSSAPATGPATGEGASDAIPAHVAIIMDGNGRWAKARGLPRAAGHERGVEALRNTVEAAREMGIRCVTVFSFSTENWRRPTSEVSALFGLLKAYIRRDLARLKREGVRVRIAGTRDNLPEDIAKLPYDYTLIKQARVFRHGFENIVKIGTKFAIIYFA